MFRHHVVKSCPSLPQQESTALLPVTIRVFALSFVLSLRKAMDFYSNSFSFRASLGVTARCSPHRAAASLFIHTLCHFSDILKMRILVLCDLHSHATAL